MRISQITSRVWPLLIALLGLVLTAGQCGQTVDDPGGTDNAPPVADAGSDQAVFVGDTVALDGTASTDPDGDTLTFAWAFDSRPSGSDAALAGADTATPTFTADAPGAYVVILTVSDGALEASDGVSVSASQATAGSPLIEDFTASPDVVPSGGTATLSWSVSGDEPITLVLDQGIGDVSGESSVEVAPASTTTYTLTAVNAEGSTSASTTVVVNDPPVVEAFAADDEVGVMGHPLSFAWSVSDPDGDSLTCTLDPGSGAANVVVSDCGANTSATHTYDAGGDFTAVLRVEDDDGAATQEATTARLMTKLFPSDGSIDVNFGNAVAISGDTIVVGAFSYNEINEGPGSAYVFVHDGTAWTEQAKLTAGEGDAPDWFGRAVAIDGDTIVVGAALGGDSGAAYVFARTGSTWAQVDKLTASDTADVRRFGRAVSIDGRVIVVGASGSAYVFAGSDSDFTEVDELASDDADAFGSFGSAVAVSGDRVVVGARHADVDPGTELREGAAHVFLCVEEAAPAQVLPRPQCTARWVREQRLTASNAAERDAFGSAVAFDGATVVVGAPSKDARGDNSGMVYSFTHDGSVWSEEDSFTADDGASSDFFGSSLALQGDTIVVGAALDDDRGPNSGSVYTFTRDGSMWVQSDKLTAADGAAEDRFGQSVGISGSSLVIGTRADDDLLSDEGFAYVLGP